MLPAYQREFIDFVIECGALRFGEFTLKSGRVSPYFFNTGIFNSGHRLARLGHFYAQAIVASGVEYDMVFGPAYKGIPLVAATAIALDAAAKRDVPYAFNRKEAKDHGEGGNIVGSPLEGKVLIIDDVISAGLSVGESARLIARAGASATGVVVAVDRQERGTGQQSAVQDVEQKYSLSVISIIKLDTLITYLVDTDPGHPQLAAIHSYRATYGV